MAEVLVREAPDTASFVATCQVCGYTSVHYVDPVWASAVGSRHRCMEAA